MGRSRRRPLWTSAPRCVAGRKTRRGRPALRPRLLHVLRRENGLPGDDRRRPGQRLSGRVHVGRGVSDHRGRLRPDVPRRGRHGHFQVVARGQTHLVHAGGQPGARSSLFGQGGPPGLRLRGGDRRRGHARLARRLPAKTAGPHEQQENPGRGIRGGQRLRCQTQRRRLAGPVGQLRRHKYRVP